MKRITTIALVLNVLLLVQLFVLNKINDKMFVTVNNYYDSAYKDFNKNIKSIYPTKFNQLNYKEIKEIDSLFSYYLADTNLNLKEILQMKKEIYRLDGFLNLEGLYSEFDYQFKLMNTNSNHQILLKTYINLIRNKILYYKLYKLNHHNLVLNCSTSFIRFHRSKCDEMFMGRFYITDVYKIQSKQFNKTIELQNNFKIPKSDLEKFKDSLKISVLNDEGNKFIPAEVHYIN